ncbi:MAG TPA: hypothetical protein VH679_06940 [Vicinamibacterales bacterium]|jgi:hypothetical protein
MITRRVLAIALAFFMAVGAAPMTMAQQVAGVLGGRATDEARKPYTDYSVQLRNPVNGQVVATQPLTDKGLFNFDTVELNQRLLVELVNLKQNKVICTEGPFLLSAPALMTKTDVNIDCGKPPAALWLLVAGAGAAGAIALGTRSASQ